MGLMAHVPIHENDAGITSANAATSSTIAPIHRAMKSQILFIYVIDSFMQKYEKIRKTQMFFRLLSYL